MAKFNYEQFLALPDWKKLKLLRKKKQFADMRMQTKEQEERRKINILKICAYFTMNDFHTFTMNVNQRYFYLYAYWPRGMELFITPQLLDSLPINLFFYYGNCYCCEHYRGYNKTGYRLINTSNVKSLYGLCREMHFEDAGFDTSLSPDYFHVKPTDVCVAWNPLPLYEQILDYNIKKLFAENKTNGYEYSDYKMDMKNISLWKYFSGIDIESLY